MTIKTISYQKSFVIGPYLQEKIGVEIEVDEEFGDKPDNIFAIAKATVDKWHKESNPSPNEELPPERLHELHKDYGQPQIIHREQTTNAKTALITDMNNCKSIPELETYKTLSSSNPELNEAYKRKYSELLNQ